MADPIKNLELQVNESAGSTDTSIINESIVDESVGSSSLKNTNGADNNLSSDNLELQVNESAGSTDTSIINESNVDESACSSSLNNFNGADNNLASNNVGNLLVKDGEVGTSSGPIHYPEYRDYILPGMPLRVVLEPGINLAPKKSVYTDGSDLCQDIPTLRFFYNLGVRAHQYAVITNQVELLPTPSRPSHQQTDQSQTQNQIPKKSYSEDSQRTVSQLYNAVVVNGTDSSHCYRNETNSGHGMGHVAADRNMHQSNAYSVHMNSQNNSQDAYQNNVPQNDTYQQMFQ